MAVETEASMFKSCFCRPRIVGPLRGSDSASTCVTFEYHPLHGAVGKLSNRTYEKLLAGCGAFLNPEGMRLAMRQVLLLLGQAVPNSVTTARSLGHTPDQGFKKQVYLSAEGDLMCECLPGG